MAVNPYASFYDTQLENTVKRVHTELKKPYQAELLGYVSYLQDDVKSSPARTLNLMQKIMQFYKLLDKPLSKATLEDAHRLVKHTNKQDWKERTKGDFKAIYKQYRKWLSGNIDFPDDVRWIRRKQLLDSRLIAEKSPSEIMRVEDFKRFLSACNTPRDKALFGLIGELGLRPREAIMLRNKNVDISNKEYVLVTVPSDTKTGFRTVPAIFTKRWILEWKLKYHPDKDNANAFFFVQERRNRDQAIGYKGLADKFKEIYKRSGIKKKLTLYDLRKFSYTFKATKGWGDQQIKAFHGLDPKSKAIDVYVRIDCRDLIDPMKQLSGLKVVKVRNKEMEVISCPNCETEQPGSNRQCEVCGVILDITEANKALAKAKQGQKELRDLKAEMQRMDKILQGLDQQAKVEARKKK